MFHITMPAKARYEAPFQIPAQVSFRIMPLLIVITLQGNTWSGLFRMKRLSGEPMQTFMTASPIMDISGTVVATCATVVELERLHVPPGECFKGQGALKVGIESLFF